MPVSLHLDLNFNNIKTLQKSTVTFNYRIVDGHIEFPYCMLLFDKSTKLETEADPETLLTGEGGGGSYIDKFTLFKALPMSSDLSCSDLVEDLCKLELLVSDPNVI